MIGTKLEPKLSILICTIPEREHFLNRLMDILTEQNGDYEILINGSNQNIGAKRNALLAEASGEYVAFVDDDDEVSGDYIEQIMKGIQDYPDCCSLLGIMTTDGKNPEYFEHSIKYYKYRTTENKIKYERYPNHLNTIRASIAKQFLFPEKNHGEDTDWATQIHKSGKIRSEFEINKPIYFYEYRTKK